MSKIARSKPPPTLLAIILGMSLATAMHAQVGHPPTSSPYRDQRAKYLFSLNGGYSGGSGGKVKAGPSTGPIVGARFDLHLSGPGSVHAGINLGQLERHLIDPSADPEDRVAAVERQSVIMADVGAYLVLTGQKTWHGFAPYFGASMGIALGGTVPGDTLSPFNFSTKFMVGPQLGFRWHAGRRIFLRVEGRDMLWKLSYPNEFFDGDPPVLDRALNKESEWTHNPMLMASLGVAF